MAELRIPVILNKGQRGIPLQKLARISLELQHFLELLGQDIQIDPALGWVGTDFYDGSVGFTLIKVNAVEERKAVAFRQAFRNVATRKPDARVRPSTVRQYTRIAEPIGPGETVGFQLPAPDDSQQPLIDEWQELTKHDALMIASEIQTVVRSHGAIQGVMHSLFLGASPPHFQLRELSTGDLIKCVYDSQKMYDQITNILKKRNAVIHVYGIIKTDITNRQIEELRVDKIDFADTFSSEDFERFIGCAPSILQGQTLQEFIDEVRGRAG